jgi:glycosyltransferase involved in cell wall biosynthesis
MVDRLVLALPDDARPGVVWHAPLLNYSGYADEARGFVLGLRERGVELRAEALGGVAPSFIAGMAPDMKASLDDALRQPAIPHAVHVVHLPADQTERVPGAGYQVCRSMFETDGLPNGWAARLNAMDEIWVPTTFNERTFRSAGVGVPVHVVPGGVHPGTFGNADPLPIEGLRSTVFLSVFEWTYRKGWDLLLKAWAKAFSPRDDVTLLIRTYPTGLSKNVRSADDIERVINTTLGKLGTSRKRVAPIVLLHDHIPEADMPRLYATASAYVAPSRGEGWGRPLIEAMATGLPVIATRWSGNLDFMNDDTSLLLDVERLEVIDEREEVFSFFRGQRWARPSVTHLTKLLQQVVADPAGVAAIGARARADVSANWTWEQAVAIAANRLEEIATSLRRGAQHPDGPPVRWVGEQYSFHSLAQVNRELCKRLVGNGAVELEIESREHAVWRALKGDGVAALEARTGGVLTRVPRVEVRHQWPPDWTAPRQGAWVAIQPWEFGGLPDEWVKQLEAVDEVWCYTNYVRDCYVASGVPAERVRVIPLGVDAELFRPDGAQHALRTTKRTKLLFVGGTISRKGIDVLLDAYTSAFGPEDDVCLVVKSFGATGIYRNGATDDRIRALAADPTMPEIELLADELSPESMAALYRSCDALVHPYRGEGFGMPIAEAMATGLPVVVTGHGAALDFCDTETAFLVPATVVPMLEDGMPPSATGYWWAEPERSALAGILRRVLDQPDVARAVGRRGRERVLARLSWDAAAATVQERLTALAQSVPTRFQNDLALSRS